MHVTPTHLAYYLICKRKTWLFSHGINMEQSSDTVYEGKLISEDSYSRRSRKYTELDLGNAKIDFYDADNQIVHEVKKSNKLEEAHLWQVRYYLHLLKEIGIENPTGQIEYPKLNKIEKVELSKDDEIKLENMIREIELLIDSDEIPETINKPYCKKCSYYEYCYS